MLLGCAWFLALSEAREDAVLPEQSFPCRSLDVDHLWLSNIAVRWDRVEVEIFSENDYAGTVLQHVSRGAVHGLDGYCFSRVVRGRRRRRGRCGNSLGDIAEELQHILKRIGIVL